MSDKVEIVGPAGTVEQVTEEQAKEQLRVPGFRRVTDADRDIATSEAVKHRRARTPEQRAKAVGEVVARGLTAGVSDILLTDALGVDSQEMLERKEALGVAGDVAELATIIGTTILSGGTGLAGKLASKTPIGALTKGAAKVGGKFGSKTAGLVAEGVIDGTVFDVAHTAGDLALHNKQLTGEELAGSIFRGAGTGLIGGLVARGAGAALDKASRVRRNVLRAGTKETDEVVSALDSQIAAAEKVAKEARAAAKAEPRTIGTVSAKVPDEVAQSEAFGAVLRDLPEAPPGARVNPRAGLPELIEELDTAAIAARQAQPPPAPARALDDTVGLGESLKVNTEALEQMAKAQKAIEADIGQLSVQNMTKVVTDASFDDAKAMRVLRNYGDYLASAKKALPGGSSLLDEVSVGVGESMAKAVRKQFGNEAGSLFQSKAGKLAAAAVAADVAAETQGIDLIPVPKEVEALVAMFALSRMGRGKAAPKGKGGLLSALLGGGVSRSAQSVAGQAASRAGAAPAVAQAVRGAVAPVGRRAGSRLADAMEGDLSQLMAREQSARGRIGRSMLRLAKGSVRHTPSRIRLQDIGKTFLFGEGEELPKDNVKAFQTVHDRMAELMNDPQKLMVKVSEATSNLDLVAPELANNTRDSLIRSLQFLWQKMPKNSGSLKTIYDDRWTPDPLAVASWLRYAQAVADPASIFEQAAALRLSPEAAEVAQTLHRGHMQDAADLLMENHESFGKAGLEVKIQIAMLTGQATHPSLLQFNSIQGNFQVLNEQSAQAAAQAPAPDNSGRGTTTEPTQVQKLESRP